MAEMVSPGHHDHFQHFITDSSWPLQLLEHLVARHAQRLLGGPDAVLIIDDTCLTKFGTHSVGVGRQYSGQAGKVTNCQRLVSVTIARDEIPLPLCLKLFLPSEWSSDEPRCERVGVPLEHPRTATKWELALARSLTFGMVPADAGYGVSAKFRQALTLRGWRWSVGTVKTQHVYPAGVGVLPIPKIFRGRPPTQGAPSEDTESIETVLSRASWRHLMWCQGTKGPLTGTFAAAYVRLADRPSNGRGQHLPGEGAWIIGEQRARGEKKYYLCQ